jgi:hypothetical protein
VQGGVHALAGSWCRLLLLELSWHQQQRRFSRSKYQNSPPQRAWLAIHFLLLLSLLLAPQA